MNLMDRGILGLKKWSKITTFGIVATAVLASVSGCSRQAFNLESEEKVYGQKAKYITDVDILWVIDSSGSMAKHQDLLSSQVNVFVNALNDTRLNYQIAVTSMDMSANGDKGRFLARSGTPLILNPKTPNLTAILEDRLRLGNSGSFTERGMEAVRAALTPPLSNGMNAGFLRPNALLVLIFLSDENDKSAVFDDVALLDQLRPALPLGDRSWVAHFLGVVPNEPSCKTTEWGYSYPGYRYINLAKASGGVSEAICDADFRRALTNVKSRLLELITEFPLNRKPLIETIKVYVNGVLIPKSNTDGWSYDAVKNSIRFHGSAVPGPDTSIHVTFDPEGLR
jgi:hypothetical protein